MENEDARREYRPPDAGTGTNPGTGSGNSSNPFAFLANEDDSGGMGSNVRGLGEAQNSSQSPGTGTDTSTSPGTGTGTRRRGRPAKPADWKSDNEARAQSGKSPLDIEIDLDNPAPKTRRKRVSSADQIFTVLRTVADFYAASRPLIIGIPGVQENSLQQIWTIDDDEVSLLAQPIANMLPDLPAPVRRVLEGAMNPLALIGACSRVFIPRIQVQTEIINRVRAYNSGESAPNSRSVGNDPNSPNSRNGNQNRTSANYEQFFDESASQ